MEDYRAFGKSHDNIHLDKDAMFRRQYDTDQSPDDDEHYLYSYKSIETEQRSPSAVARGKKFVSENNIQYETVTHRYANEMTSSDARKRRPNSSGSEIFTDFESHALPQHQSPHQLHQQHKGIYKKSGTPSMKEYRRFYGTSADDACDDDGPKRSSDESSSSPNSKSVLNSPDTVVPLLQSPTGYSSPTRRSRIPISISTLHIY